VSLILGRINMRFAILALVLVLALAFGVAATAPTTSSVMPVKDSPAVTPLPPKGSLQGGDTIETATLIASLPYDDTGTTVGYTNNYDEVCFYSGSLSPDVVYKYSPTADGYIDIYTCNSGFDTKLYVYDNVYTPGAPLACNDDSSVCSGPSYRSYIEALQILAGHTYYIVVDGYGSASGAYEFHVRAFIPPPPCEPICPPYAIQEGEPTCYTDYTDIYNGGCNSTPTIFQPISFPQTVCGTSGVYAFGLSTYRDTDWFQFTLTAPKSVKFAVCAEFPPLVGLIDASLGCPVSAFLTSATGAAYTEISVTYALPAGTFWAFVAPMDWGAYPCGAKYVATLWEEGTVPVQPTSWGVLKALYR
jgi:hypothetical protein